MKLFDIIISRKLLPEEVKGQKSTELLYSNTFFAESSYDIIYETLENQKITMLGEWITTEIILSKKHLSIFLIVYDVDRDISNFTQFLETSYVAAPINKPYNLKSLNNFVVLRGNDHNEGYTLDPQVIKEIELNDGIDVIKAEHNFEGGASSGFENFLINIGTSLLANGIYDYFKSYKSKSRNSIQYIILNLSSEIKETISNVYCENPNNIYLKSFEIDQTNDSVLLVFQSNRFSYRIELSNTSEILNIETEKIINKSKPMKKKKS